MINKLANALCLAALLGGCAVTDHPAKRIDMSARSAGALGTQAEENTTDFTEVLSCVGVQVAAYGSKSFYVGNDKITNETGIREGIPDSARTMLQSAFGTLVEKSNGKIVWSGWSTSIESKALENISIETSNAKKLRSTDTPEFVVTGAISQYEKDIQKASRDIDASISTSRIGDSAVANLSLLATNLTLLSVTSKNYSMYKGIQSNNVIAIRSEEVATGILLGTARVGGVGVNVAVNKREGVSAALMQLMQLGAVEIVGKFYKDDFDYRHCLVEKERKRIITELSIPDMQLKDPQRRLSAKPVELTLRPSFVQGTSFRVGDTVKAIARVNDNGYLYCFYTMGNGNTVKVFPNKYATENLISENQLITVPGSDKLKIIADPIMPNAPRDRITCIFSRTDISSLINGLVGTSTYNRTRPDEMLSKVKAAVPEQSHAMAAFDIDVR